MCPVAFLDREGLWADGPPILPPVRLRLLVGEEAFSGEVPLRLLPASSRLFRDAEQSLRWFIAPYARLVLVSAASPFPPSLEWVAPSRPRTSDLASGNDDLLVLVERDERAAELLFGRLAGSIGPRQLLRLRPPDSASEATLEPAQDLRRLADRLGELVSQTASRRVGLYARELRRLEGVCRAGASEERPAKTRELFAVLESLALMLQMLRQPRLALERYGALSELLLSGELRLSPAAWPLSPEPDAASRLRTLRRSAAELLDYDIVATRTRLLRNRISSGELAQYLFARQMTLLQQARPGPGEGTRRLLDLVELVQKDLGSRPSLSGLKGGVLAAYFGLAASLETWSALAAQRLMDPNLLLFAMGNMLRLHREFPGRPLWEPSGEDWTSILDATEAFLLHQGPAPTAALCLRVGETASSYGWRRVGAAAFLRAVDLLTPSPLANDAVAPWLRSVELSSWPHVRHCILLAMFESSVPGSKERLSAALQLADPVFSECSPPLAGCSLESLRSALTVDALTELLMRPCFRILESKASIEVSSTERLTLPLQVTSHCPVPLEVADVEVTYEGEGSSLRQLLLRAEKNVQLVAGINLIPLRADEDALPGRYSAKMARVDAGLVRLLDHTPPLPEVFVQQKDKKTDPSSDVGEVRRVVLPARSPFVQLVLTNTSSESTWIVGGVSLTGHGQGTDEIPSEESQWELRPGDTSMVSLCANDPSKTHSVVSLTKLGSSTVLKLMDKIPRVDAPVYLPPDDFSHLSIQLLSSLPSAPLDGMQIQLEFKLIAVEGSYFNVSSGGGVAWTPTGRTALWVNHDQRFVLSFLAVDASSTDFPNLWV